MSGEVGSAYVKIRPDMTALDRELERLAHLFRELAAVLDRHLLDKQLDSEDER